MTDGGAFMTGGTMQDQFLEQFPTLVLHRRSPENGPRPGAEMYQIRRRRTQHNVVPQSGDVVVFPSYLRHAVFPYRGGGERISVAFNARLTVE